MKNSCEQTIPGQIRNQCCRWRIHPSPGSVALLLIACISSTLLYALRERPNVFNTRHVIPNPLTSDPADQWQDDTWPLRPQTPWDISTDYPFPRLLEYDVQEGTWMRLDVHPRSADIVFDLLGDLYCLPGESYRHGPTESLSRARPILLGVPHDSDPHFSPDGKYIAFRSDAELGVDNAWIMDWKGCGEMDIRPSSATGALLDALLTARHEEDSLALGIQETKDQKRRRLLREGRLGARRITNETFRWVTDPRFHPSGKKIITSKWYTSRGTAGAPEGWEYRIPSGYEEKVDAGAGKRIINRTLPPGWSPSQYNDVTVGPEQFIWSGNDSIIYAKNVVDTDGHWNYGKDVHSGIYALFSYNLTTQKTMTLVPSTPGSASRPELSRDRRSLAFVRRVRDKEALVIKHVFFFSDSTIHHVWDGLTYDSTMTYAPMGTYPSFAFSPGDNAVIIWAAGQIYHVPLATNSLGEKVLGSKPAPIPFIAHVEKRVAETRRVETDVLRLGLEDQQRIHAFTELRANEDGSQVVFQASGTTYVYSLHKAESERLRRVPVLQKDASYFSPSFVPWSDELIIHARWSDRTFTTFELANLTSGEAYELVGLSLGRYYSPVLGENSKKPKLAFIKTAGDTHTGNVVATAGAGLYIADLHMDPQSSSATIQNIRFISESPATSPPARTKLRFLDDDTKILVQQPESASVIDIASGPNTSGEYFTRTIASGRTTTELVASLANKDVDVAAVDFHHVYLAPNLDPHDPLWAKPGNSTKGLVRLTVDGGHDVVWSVDGTILFWLTGPSLHVLNKAELKKCADTIAGDTLNFGISCSKDLPEVHELFVEHPTEIYRLKQETVRQNASILAFTNASALTMATGSLPHDALQNVTILVRDGLIEDVIPCRNITLPSDAVVIDAEGAFITPGFIDIHGHWDVFNQFYPAQSWEMLTFLAYGVTTIHNPSGSNVLGYWERSRIEGGQSVGPRIFQVGDVVFGGTWTGLHEEINSMDEAYAALRRIKAEGGPASFSYKNYDLPSRRTSSTASESQSAAESSFTRSLGMTTVEHSLPIPVLYDDIKTLFILSGTSYTPTHVVNYGGVFGEEYVWATEDIPNDPKGLRAHIGAHGENPKGLLYHSEMFFARLGGRTNYEVLRAATADAATTLGIFSALGSISPGKFADLLVFTPGSDLLEGDIKNTRDIRYVVRGGRVWDAETMVEVWPNQGRKVVLPPLNPE
ncbi:hypothetical protein EIP86_005430 [Pleurotus ostreatoroseus]|nr:hypothetical protein EIP86_005430 [Pleurotus ostreatoroseus]